MSPEVLVALIVTAGGLITAIITAAVQFRKMSKENQEQHGAGYSLLQSIDSRVEKIHTEVDGLTVWQAQHDEHHRHQTCGTAGEVPVRISPD